MKALDLSSAILHSDRYFGTEQNAVHQPIHVSSQYSFADVHELISVFNGKNGFAYSRQGTPTTGALERQISLLEQAVSSICFASGMAALSAVFFTLLQKGDHLICSRYIFGNTKSLLMTLEGLGVEVSMVDSTNMTEVEQALQSNTRMLFTETIANPVTQVSDLVGMGEFCQAHGLVYFIDATMATPYLLDCRAINASLVMHSLSKALCGHANAIGGSISNTGLYDWSDYPNIYDMYKVGPANTWGMTQIKKKGLRDMGATLSSDAAHRIAIGLETFELRIQRACDNALLLARFMQDSPIFSQVNYPGLRSHEQHQRARELFKDKGYGALLSVELRADIDMYRFLNALQVVVLATHLGDNRTLCLPVAPTIYSEATAEQRKLMGISDHLLRISVGTESIQDLIGDFKQAYELSQKS